MTCEHLRTGQLRTAVSTTPSYCCATPLLSGSRGGILESRASQAGNLLDNRSLMCHALTM